MIKIKESFLGFVAMSSSTAENVAETAVKKLQDLGITIERLRAQGYEGASVTSGVYNGVQALIKGKIDSPALFVHCGHHNLHKTSDDHLGEYS